MRIGSGSNIPAVTKNLLIINFIIWIAQAVLPRIGIDVTGTLGMHYIGSRLFGVWQLGTYMFLHAGGFGHIFSNMFALFMFGPVLERLWGSRRFLLYYLATGIGAGLVQQVTWYLTMTPELAYYQDYMLTIGASGAIFGILLAFGMMFPTAPIFLFLIPIPIQAKWFVILYGLFELFAGIAHTGGDNVAHFAHLGGMLFGFVLIQWWRKRVQR